MFFLRWTGGLLSSKYLKAFHFYFTCNFVQCKTMSADVTVVIPLHNAEAWLDECLESVYFQSFRGKLEISVFDDSSTDKSSDILLQWKPRLASKGIDFVIGKGKTSKPGGVGYAKNRAVEQSTGQFLCFLDADDVMHPDRILKQHSLAMSHMYGLNSIIGCKFHRMPSGSTARYTEWANNLQNEQLCLQVYTSHGPTLIMPTWFMHRSIFSKVNGFSEAGKGTPEDLLFFYKHLDNNGKLLRVDEDLLMYRYHEKATSFSIPEETIWIIRLQELERKVLDKLPSFTIWNAGRLGRKLYRCLSDKLRNKVVAFCDVDVKKIAKGIYIFEESKVKPNPRVPIIHFKDAKPPFIICVKQNLTKGDFERYLNSLNLTEGVDYFHFG